MAWLLGFDAGNSETVLLASEGKDTQMVSFPSFIGSGNVDELERVRSGVAANSSLVADEYVLEADNRTYYIGTLAQRESRDGTSARGDSERYWSGHTRRLFLAAMGKLLEDHAQMTASVTHLVTGLPVELWTKENVRRVKHSLAGTHQFRLNGHAYRVTVDAVNIVMEGGAALAAHGKPGNVVQGVVDIGGRTTDLFYADGMLPVSDRCGGFDRGVERVAELLNTHVLREYGRNLRPDEIRNILHSYAAGLAHNEMYSQGTPIPSLLPIVAQHCTSIGDEIASYVSRRWRDGERGLIAPDAAQVLLIGGGAHYFTPALRMLIPHIIVPLKPEWANVRGYLVMAQQFHRMASVAA